MAIDRRLHWRQHRSHQSRCEAISLPPNFSRPEEGLLVPRQHRPRIASKASCSIWGYALVKAGQVDVARIVYANAKYADNYAAWPYRQVLESKLASDLNARAALYADNDPMNDPPDGSPKP